jgi:hypothetical protein
MERAGEAASSATSGETAARRQAVRRDLKGIMGREAGDGEEGLGMGYSM